MPSPAWATAFPVAGACDGYKLTADLDLDTDRSGDANEGDDYWDGGKGWNPIGSSSTNYTSAFEGGGHVIRNLFISRTRDDVGLFGSV